MSTSLKMNFVTANKYDFECTYFNFYHCYLFNHFDCVFLYIKDFLFKTISVQFITIFNASMKLIVLAQQYEDCSMVICWTDF